MYHVNNKITGNKTNATAVPKLNIGLLILIKLLLCSENVYYRFRQTTTNWTSDVNFSMCCIKGQLIFILLSSTLFFFLLS